MTRGRLIRSAQWPAEIVLVRHGQSQGNIADEAARSGGAHRLELDLRDADVPLSDTGEDQADAIGGLLRRNEEPTRPHLVVSSPYQRAAQTATRALERSGLGIDLIFDERLRERDLGLFDGMTAAGIRTEYPDEAQRRSHVGKFYYQPPSGESWCDVTLRVRSFLADVREGYPGKNVWLFTHQAVIMAFRYVLEDLSEQELLDVEKETALPNCSVTSYRVDGDGVQLVSFADTTAVDQAPARTTAEPPQAGRGDDAG